MTLQELYDGLPSTREQFAIAAMNLARAIICKFADRWLHSEIEGECGLIVAELLATGRSISNVRGYLSTAFFQHAGINTLKREHLRAMRPLSAEPAARDLVSIDELLPGLDPTDRTIAQRRAEGYTDSEIGNELGITGRRVGQRRKAIEERYA